MTIKISIIVPVYNTDKYLEKCINSIINQTLQEIEVIIVNDGSIDKSLEIAEHFAAKDNRVILINLSNSGVSAARNAGLEIAKGEYIGFVDSDDWIDSDFYENLYKAAKKHNADMGITSVLKHKKHYNTYNVIHLFEKVAISLNAKINICKDKKQRLFSVWNRIYKRELINDNHIEFPVGRVFEDVTFSMQAIFYANSIVSVPNTKYHYVERGNSIIKSGLCNEKKRQDALLACIRLQNFAHKNRITLPERLNYYTSYWKTPLIKVYEGKYKKCFKLFGVIPLFSCPRNSRDKTREREF